MEQKDAISQRRNAEVEERGKPRQPRGLFPSFFSFRLAANISLMKKHLSNLTPEGFL